MPLYGTLVHMRFIGVLLIIMHFKCVKKERNLLAIKISVMQKTGWKLYLNLDDCFWEVNVKQVILMQFNLSQKTLLLLPLAFQFSSLWVMFWCKSELWVCEALSRPAEQFNRPDLILIHILIFKDKSFLLFLCCLTAFSGRCVLVYIMPQANVWDLVFLRCHL